MSLLRSTIRTSGELLITAGLIVLLFVGYQLFWTNLAADEAAATVTDDLRHAWATQPPPPGAHRQGNANEPTRPAPGQGLAILHMPRLGRHYQTPVVEGVTMADLARGVGHYPGTALPGQVGNFAIAGHRATNGEPFRRLDEIRPGDAVVVETGAEWLTYRVERTRIVAPTDVDVLLPVPGKPAAKPTRALLTLTTCNPRWASYQRLIVSATLAARQPRAAGRPVVLARGS